MARSGPSEAQVITIPSAARMPHRDLGLQGFQVVRIITPYLVIFLVLTSASHPFLIGRVIMKMKVPCWRRVAHNLIKDFRGVLAMVLHLVTYLGTGTECRPRLGFQARLELVGSLLAINFTVLRIPCLQRSKDSSETLLATTDRHRQK